MSEKKRVGRPCFDKNAYEKQISFRCGNELHDKIKEHSKEQGIPVLHMIRIILEKYFINLHVKTDEKYDENINGRV